MIFYKNINYIFLLKIILNYPQNNFLRYQGVNKFKDARLLSKTLWFKYKIDFLRLLRIDQSGVMIHFFFQGAAIVCYTGFEIWKAGK